MYIFYVIYFYSFLYYISSSAFLDLIWFSFYQSVSSVTQSCPTLWPHGQQHSRLPCTSPTPRAYSISCPSSQWCHPTILSSVIPFSCVQSFPALGSFPVSQFFTGEGNGTPLQYSCLENPRDGEPGGLPAVYGVAQSRTQLKWLSSSSSSSHQVAKVLEFQLQHQSF